MEQFLFLRDLISQGAADMSSMRSYSDWNKRSSDLKKQIEPYRRYVFICEGENTEKWYFSHLIEIRKELGIHPLIDIQLMEKPEGEESFSNPKKLIEFADYLKRRIRDGYDKNHDRMVIVFDADIYERRPDLYEEIIRRQDDYIFAVTNPSFELFLLLHYENSFREIIEPHADIILRNPKEGKKRRYIDKLFSSVSKMNAKQNPEVGKLAERLDIAISEECNVNQDIQKAIGQITSNVGKVIQSIRDDAAF